MPFLSSFALSAGEEEEKEEDEEEEEEEEEAAAALTHHRFRVIHIGLGIGLAHTQV